MLIPLTTGFMRVFGKQYASSVTVRVKDVSQIDAAESAVRELCWRATRPRIFRCAIPRRF